MRAAALLLLLATAAAAGPSPEPPAPAATRKACVRPGEYWVKWSGMRSYHTVFAPSGQYVAVAHADRSGVGAIFAGTWKADGGTLTIVERDINSAGAPSVRTFTFGPKATQSACGTIHLTPVGRKPTAISP